jgi:hypothetical protein
MNQPQCFINELVAGSIIALQTIVSYALLSLVPPDRYALMEWTLLTFLGASGASAACFCLNTRIELRKIIIGRCIFALIFGVVLTRVAYMVHPIVEGLLDDPLILIGSGALFGFFGWHLSKALFQRAQEREEHFARMIVQSAENRLAQHVAVLVADNAAVIAEPLAKKVEAVAAALEQNKISVPQHVEVTIRPPVEENNKEQ